MLQRLIDAVIDARGNVVGMHVLSGPPLLISAATDALRRWKYEPTIVSNQAFPVQLAGDDYVPVALA